MRFKRYGGKISVSGIKHIVCQLIADYPVTKVILFGSRAYGTQRTDSDVDLMVEFSQPISLITFNSLRFALEDTLRLKVDLIHGPLTEADMIVPKKEVLLYAA